jgi:hypothetical protein
VSRRGVPISLWDRLRNPIGWFLGYGRCERCHRSWWYQPWGAGVPIDHDGNAIPDETAFRGSSRHALCASCERDLTFDQRLNWDIVFVQMRKDGDLRRYWL